MKPAAGHQRGQAPNLGGIAGHEDRPQRAQVDLVLGTMAVAGQELEDHQMGGAGHRYDEPGQQLQGLGPSDDLRLDTRRSEEQVDEHPSGDGGFESDGGKPVDIPVLDDGLHPVPCLLYTSRCV